MLNRRYLRVKAFQALYAFFQAEGGDVLKSEKEMLKSIEKIYDLYLLMLLLITEVADSARDQIETARQKRLPTHEDLNPNLRFVNNIALNILEENNAFQKLVSNKKLTWFTENDQVRKLYREIRESQEYQEYMNSNNPGFDADRKFIITIFREYMAEFEVFQQLLEDRSIYWYDDLTLVVHNVVKTFQQLKPSAGAGSNILMPLYKDREDDLQFVKELFRKTIFNENDYQEMISSKTKNWEVDRIAVLDVILMKMALCEFEHFNSIPVKVSLNEYIELAKSYSTPKSKVFINGILDKLLIDWRKSGRIKKTGRGLIE
ncbi:MAG: transcription antitermination factor NusB [Salibacteraceae bacterium]